MPKKGGSPKKGGKKAAKKAAPAIPKMSAEEEVKRAEEYNNMINIPEHGWIKLDMKISNWKFNYFPIYVKSNDWLSKIYFKIIEKHGRVDDIRIFLNEPGTVKPEGEGEGDEETSLDDMNMEIHELLDSFGDKVKKQAPEFPLYYDFKPHDSDEPILLEG